MAKQGQLGLMWIYGLVTILVIGVLFVIFNTVFTDNLLPVYETQTNQSGANVTFVNNALAEKDKIMEFWSFVPFVLIFLIIIYFVKVATKKSE